VLKGQRSPRGENLQRKRKERKGRMESFAVVKKRKDSELQELRGRGSETGQLSTLLLTPGTDQGLKKSDTVSRRGQSKAEGTERPCSRKSWHQKRPPLLRGKEE